MTDLDVTRALEHATEHLSPPPDLLDRVRAGGRRRLIRRRALLTGGLAVAAAGAGVPLALRRDPAPLDPATRGDLARNRRFLAAVRSAWRDGAADYGATADPSIVWAGTTPAGPAALVSQPARLAEGPDLDSVGLVWTAGRDLRVASSTVPRGALQPCAVLLGPRHDLVLLADRGEKVSYSADYSFGTDGTIKRSFDAAWPATDGVRPVPVPAQTDRIRFALRPAALHTRVSLLNIDEVLSARFDATNKLPDRIDRLLPGREAAWGPDAQLTSAVLRRWDVSSLSFYEDTFGYHQWTGPSPWSIRGATPDGRRLMVQTVPLDGGARVFYSLSRSADPPVPAFAGTLTSALATTVPAPQTGTLSVLRLRLPQSQGVVVAALNATFRYRTTTPAWLPAKGDAALLPPAATAVEVTPRAGTPVTIPLP